MPSTQYHTALILLHRIFPTQSLQAQTARHSGSIHFSTLSRNVCVSNAVEVAKIIGQYRKRFAIQRVFVTGLQHVGTAATALMAEVSMLQKENNSAERRRLLSHLHNLRDTMKEMSEMYQPAVLMSAAVGHFIRDSGDATSRDDTHNAGTQASDFSLASISKLPVTVPSTAHGTRASTLVPLDPTSTSTSLPASSSQIHVRGTATPIWGFQNSHPPFETGGGLPFLPSSWFEEMNWEDTEFLNLMGLKDLQNAGLGSGAGVLMDEFEMGGLDGSSAGGGRLYDA